MMWRQAGGERPKQQPAAIMADETPAVLRTQIWLFFMEAAMFVLFIVQWGLTYPEGPDGTASARENSIYRYFPFVTNGALGGVALVRSAGGGRMVQTWILKSELCMIHSEPIAHASVLSISLPLSLSLSIFSHL